MTPNGADRSAFLTALNFVSPKVRASLWELVQAAPYQSVSRKEIVEWARQFGLESLGWFLDLAEDDARHMPTIAQGRRVANARRRDGRMKPECGSWVHSGWAEPRSVLRLKWDPDHESRRAFLDRAKRALGQYTDDVEALDNPTQPRKQRRTRALPVGLAWGALVNHVVNGRTHEQSRRWLKKNHKIDVTEEAVRQAATRCATAIGLGLDPR